MLVSGMYSKVTDDNVISEENIEADDEDNKVKDETMNKEVDNGVKDDGVIVEKDSEIIDQPHFSLISNKDCENFCKQLVYSQSIRDTKECFSVDEHEAYQVITDNSNVSV
ncbi:12592_t:CDS:2 [Cetraspora pellucida]|uniref:12592_t:CDS:1 n=1 Tax=Cetraspora pellucida TaxID=1433469 RepID=A0A9N8YTV7_9GLOM|nr:12592_t:CDS:2 [Cetraspora pellucida]